MKKTKKENKLNNTKPKITRWQKFLYLGGVSRKEILFFTKNLAVMLKAGLTLSEALAVLRNQAKGKLKIVLTEFAEHVEKGYKFSEALEKYPKIFSEIYINIIKIGEQSGTLEENLVHIAEQLGKNWELKKKIKGAMLYPIIVLVGISILTFGITVFVLPKVTKLFRNFQVELPLTTRILIRVADFFQNYGLWAFPITFATIIFLFWFLRSNFVKPATHLFILKAPIIKNISIHLNLTIFCRTLNILLKSGVTIDEGIKICSKTVSNLYYKNFLAYAFGKIKAGGTLAGILKEKKNLFPETDVQIINVGEKSGALSESLDYCASMHENEVDSITKNLANILEPVLLIVIGCIVGFLALAIITPIYSITGQFRG